MKVTLYKKDSSNVDISDRVKGIDGRHIFGTINALAFEHGADACLIDYEQARCEVIFKEDSPSENHQA